MYKTIHPLNASKSAFSVALEVPYTTREAQGVTVLIVVSSISFVAVVCLLVAIGLSAFNTRSSIDKHLFVRTHVAAYFICLLISDLFQSIGSILNATWVRESAVFVGNVCTTQGTLKQISDISIAFWTLVIAIHTFCLLVLELSLRQFVLWSTLIAGWFSIATLVLAGPAAAVDKDRGPFYGIAGYWCWISPNYVAERITLDYMFMFISAILSFLLYTMIFLRLRGNLYLNGWRPSFRWTPIKRVGNWALTDADDQAAIIAKHMVLYPIAYTVVFLPMAITRLSAFSGHVVSLEITIFSATLYLLSGTANVILFASARNMLPPQSMLVKKWTISLPRLLPERTQSQGDIDPYYDNSFRRTPFNEKFPDSHLNLQVPGWGDTAGSLPQISPLWIPQLGASYGDSQAEMDLTSAVSRRDNNCGLPSPQRYNSQSSYSDFEGGILDTYDDVDLSSGDSMVLAPVSDPSSESEYSAVTP